MFVQLMEYQTSNPAEVKRVHDEWAQATQDTRRAKRLLLAKHHGNGNRFCELVFFDSYEDAMDNSRLAETQQFAERFREIVDGEITYLDLDVIDEQDL